MSSSSSSTNKHRQTPKTTSFSDVIGNLSAPSKNYNNAPVTNFSSLLGPDDSDVDDDEFEDIYTDADNFKKVRFSKSPTPACDAKDNEEEFNESRHTRPVIVIPSIKQKFDADPKSSIKNNVPVHTSNKDLDNYRKEITDIAQNKKQQNEVADELWANDDYSFIKLVQGLARDPTLMNRETSVPVANVSGGFLQTGASTETFTPAPVSLASNNEVAAFLDQFHNPEYKPKDVTAYDRDYIRDRDKLRILANIDSVADLPQVSGVVQMSSVMYASIMEALSSLSMMNRNKYLHKDRSHFYSDLAVKTLFAKLVYAFIAEGKVVNPNQFYMDATERRRGSKVEFAKQNLDNHCVWDANKCAFVYAEDEQTDMIKRTKRCKFMDAFNVANFC